MRKSLIRKTLFVAIMYLSLNSKAHSQETFKGLIEMVIRIKQYTL